MTDLMRRILFLLLLPFCAGMLTLPAVGSNTVKVNPAPNRSALSDAQLDSVIRAKLAKSKIGKDGLKFHVLHGVVTWEGNTAVGQHKGAATRMARASGAVQVVNNIRVNGAGQAKAGAPLRKAQVQ